jgi:hypothetical protein
MFFQVHVGIPDTEAIELLRALVVGLLFLVEDNLVDGIGLEGQSYGIAAGLLE